MAFSLSKLFGNKTSETKLKSGDTVEAIIGAVENTPFGISEANVLYAGLNELGGFYLFQSVIVGQLKIKTNQGATVTLKADDFELTLNSDMSELESEASDIKGRNITKIDFEIEESDIENLKNAMVTNITLNVKKQAVTFTKYDDTSDEEE